MVDCRRRPKLGCEALRIRYRGRAVLRHDSVGNGSAGLLSRGAGGLPPEAAAILPPALDELVEVGPLTWQHFADHDPRTHLPVDTVTPAPEEKVHPWTSPTNIGLYLMVLTAADNLGYISHREAAGRAKATPTTVDRLEKWNGILFAEPAILDHG